MYKKYYKVIVDQEEVPFWSFEVDRNGKAITETDQYLQNIVENFVKVIDISNLDWVPLIPSRWDGQSFSKDYGIDNLNNDNKDKRRFAFIDKNNFFIGHLEYYESISLDAMMIAILSSNPIATLDRTENG
jgi:hypothetical protein